MKKLLISFLFLCSCNPRLSGPSYPINNSYWEWQYSINTKTNQKIEKQSISKQIKFGDYGLTVVLYENKTPVSSYKTTYSLGKCCQGTDDYIFRTDDNQSFRAIINVNSKYLNDVTLRLSNLIKGEYAEKVDTITHYYTSIVKFD